MFSRQDFTRSERSLVIIQRKNCKFVSYKWEVNINCNPYLQVVYIKLCHGIKISYSRGFDSGLNLGGWGARALYKDYKRGVWGSSSKKIVKYNKLLSVIHIDFFNTITQLELSIIVSCCVCYCNNVMSECSTS